MSLQNRGGGNILSDKRLRLPLIIVVVVVVIAVFLMSQSSAPKANPQQPAPGTTEAPTGVGQGQQTAAKPSGTTNNDVANAITSGAPVECYITYTPQDGGLVTTVDMKMELPKFRVNAVTGSIVATTLISIDGVTEYMKSGVQGWVKRVRNGPSGGCPTIMCECVV